ncbi:MAG: hypothetical protein Aureis2KO_03300 [Aureisphaera sp.]
MKKAVKYIALFLVFLIPLLLYSWVIVNPKPENCEVLEITASKVYEGGDKDIMVAAPNGDFYYINRGLEQGLTIEGIKKKIKNKKVTLHLPKQLFGAVTSNHIAQLTCRDEIVFTEFE